MKVSLSVLVILLSFLSSAQKDSTTYTLYRDKVVVYSDLSINTAPFSLKDSYNGDINKLKFRHNQKLILGIGFAHKWLALRLGLALPGTMKPVSRYGQASYQDLGINLNIRHSFWDIDLRNYRGYSIQDAYRWNDTLTELTPNLIVPEVRSISFSINSWFFRQKDFHMKAVLGKVGHFNKSKGTLYFKGSMNFFGIGSDNRPLVPDELIDTTRTKSFANSFSALDFGFVPGYAYVHRVNNWQISGFAGLGAALQAKFYTVGPMNRGFIGLAPRIDLRFIAGYSVPKYFIWLRTDFDIKSIKIQDTYMRQSFYSVALVGGIRFIDKDTKRKKKKRKN